MKKRNWRRVAAVVLASVMALGLLSGCGGKKSGGSSSSAKNPEEIFKEAAKKAGKEDSLKQNYSFVMAGTSEDSDVSLELNLDTDITTDPLASHSKGDVSVKLGEGGNMGVDVESYAVDDVVYANIMDTWSKSDIAYDYNDNAIVDFKELADYADDFEVTDEKDDVEGEDAVTLEGKLKLKDLPDVWRSIGTAAADLPSLIESMEADENTKVGVKVSVYKDSMLPAQVVIDMTKLAKEITGEDEAITEMMATVTYTDYGDADKIKLPSEAEDADENEADIFIGMFGDSTGILDDGGDIGGDIGGSDGGDVAIAKQNDKLSDNWKDYTVQVEDTVITLPCDYSTMIASGLTPDEDTDETRIVNKEDTDYGYFESGKDVFDYVSVTFYNPSTTDAQAITKCLIVRLSADEYAGEDGLSVIFPGGITFNSTKEEVIAAYGEPDNLYEGDSFDFLTYYDGDSYNKYMEITIDHEDNKVYDMAIQNK